MQKPANRILSALLVLVMVLSVLPASVFATGEADIFAGWSLTLGDNIGVNFYLKEEAANYSVGVTVAGNAAATTAETKDGYYVVTANVAAAQMTDTIALSVVNGEQTLHTGEYSVRQYALTIIDGQYDAEVKQMVLDMLHYGAAAQTYFDYNANNLANAGYTQTATAEIPSEVPAINVEDNLSGIALYGISLLFQNKTSVRFYFYGNGDMNSYTFKVGDTPYYPVAKGEQYYVQVDGINPQDLDKAIDLVVSKDDATLAVSYSPMTYIIRKYNSADSSEALKALVGAMNVYHETAVAYQKYLAIVSISTMSLAAQYGTNGMDLNGDGNVKNIYASADVNDAPGGSWSYEYTPVEAAGLQLIRAGETYNVGIPGSGTIVKFADAGYCIKLEAWTVANSMLPLQENDILVIDGRYNLTSDSSVVVDFDKTYIYYNGSSVEFSAEMPTLPSTVEGGVMSEVSGYGWTGGEGDLIFQMNNTAPTGGYAPTSASNIKLIRNGETYDVGYVGVDVIGKHNESWYTLAFWTIVNYKPMLANDILVVEGDFYQSSSKTTLNISKTYVLLNADGTASFSTEMPTLPSAVEGGVMQSHANGMSGNGIYFKLDANDAPFDGWSYEYVQTSSTNIKLIRDGATNDIGIVDRPLIVKYSETEYYLKLEEWTIGAYGLNGSNPITTADVIIIEGDFTHTASKTTLNITKSYVYYDGSAWVCAATLPVEVEGGNMTEHADGWDASDGVYFSLNANSVPVDENAEIAYEAASGVIQLVRGGTTYDMVGSAIKYGETDYYLSLSGSSNLPLVDGDYLIVDGAFANGDNGYTLNIARTYILVDGDNVVFSTTEPVFETEYPLTGLTNHSNGWTTDGIYISHDAHSATMNSDWSVEYKPVSADVIKLVRGGVTTNIGQPASGTLVVYSATNMYLKTAAWTIQGGVLPFVDGDKIIIEGKFKHAASGSILAVEKTVIFVNGSSLIFNAVEAGTMSNHSNGAGGDGVYATMAANDASYNSNWSLEYTPLTADAYRVIRDGVETSIGMPGRGTLVKYGETDHYLKTSGWCLNGFTAQTSDIFVIDGFWYNKDDASEIMKIEKTYLYHDGAAWVFSTSKPVIVSGGVMKTHGNGMSGNGIYFTMDANDAPYNGDWSLEYKQTSADGIKLIRDGETISIGIVDRPLFLKYSDVGYYLKLEGWTIGEYGLNGQSNPITNDDVLIIEGNFYHEATNTTLNISKSYVYYDGTAWICSDTAPVQKNIVDVVDLGSHSNGWTANGFYFTAAANDAPLNTDWSLRYKPVSADVIKLVHEGTTTNKGNTGAETIVKYSETNYYVEGWAVGMSGVVAGDVMIIEGQFYNAANDTYIEIEKTYFTFNADGSVSVLADSDKYVNAGAMSAYTSNWFGDGIYFTLSSNIVPADSTWVTRYTPKAAGNIKLVRGGEVYSIANTGAESIVKIADDQYWLSLESWWWSSYAPIQDGDQLIVEGEFANATNGYTLNIDKTYITFVSKANDEVIFSAAANTEFGDVLLPNSNGTMTIGVWNGSHHIFNDARMAELKAAGITKIMGIKPEYTGAEYGGITGMLDRAQNYGIEVIVDLRDWDGTTVPEYIDHPALLGFLMYDEPCATDFDDLAELKSKYDDIDAFDGKLFYVNLYPSCAAGTSLMGSVDWALGRRDYDTYYVQRFLDKLNIEVLSWDNYSLLSGNGIRTDYYYNFEVMASKDVPMWYTMLSSGHGTTSTSYATPTAAELRWQMAVAMTYGVQNIDHYVYTSHESGYSCMLDYNTETVTDLYYDIKTVNNEYLAWDNIFMAYEWVGTAGVKAGATSTMLDKLSKNIDLTANGLASVETTGDVLVGVFDYNGDKAYMVTNAGSANNSTVGDGKGLTMNDVTVTLNLDAADYKCVAIIDQGVITYVAVENNSVTIPVSAYEGVFVIPVLN